MYNILTENEDKKVSEVLEKLIVIMESQQRDKNHQETEHGLEMFCYYHKQWELVSQVEYGQKVNTATGLNSMCKVGTNQWTKQQRDFREDRANLLLRVRDGEITVDMIDSETDKLDIIRKSIIPLIDHHHDEALQYEKDLNTES